MSNRILSVCMVFSVLFFSACAQQEKSNPSSSKNQSVPVLNPVKTTTDSHIGKRTAAEMVAAGFKRYGIEKGMFIFRMDGAMIGTEYLYFDHWGWREGKYVDTEADIGKYDKKENKIQLLDGERRYEYNPATQQAHFFESKQVQKTADLYGTKDMTIVGDEMIKRMGGVKEGNSTIKGIECQIWNIDKYKTKLSMWKGITMAERSHPENIPVARTCILVDTLSEIPIEKLTLPEGAELIGLD